MTRTTDVRTAVVARGLTRIHGEGGALIALVHALGIDISATDTLMAPEA